MDDADGDEDDPMYAAEARVDEPPNATEYDDVFSERAVTGSVPVGMPPPSVLATRDASVTVVLKDLQDTLAAAMRARFRTVRWSVPFNETAMRVLLAFWMTRLSSVYAALYDIRPPMDRALETHMRLVWRLYRRQYAAWFRLIDTAAEAWVDRVMQSNDMDAKREFHSRMLTFWMTPTLIDVPGALEKLDRVAASEAANAGLRDRLAAAGRAPMVEFGGGGASGGPVSYPLPSDAFVSLALAIADRPPPPVAYPLPDPLAVRLALLMAGRPEPMAITTAPPPPPPEWPLPPDSMVALAVAYAERHVPAATVVKLVPIAAPSTEGLLPSAWMIMMADSIIAARGAAIPPPPVSKREASTQSKLDEAQNRVKELEIEAKSLRKQFEDAATSSANHFAKETKLQRELDECKAKYKELKAKPKPTPAVVVAAPPISPPPPPAEWLLPPAALVVCAVRLAECEANVAALAEIPRLRKTADDAAKMYQKEVDTRIKLETKNIELTTQNKVFKSSNAELNKQLSDYAKQVATLNTTNNRLLSAPPPPSPPSAFNKSEWPLPPPALVQLAIRCAELGDALATEPMENRKAYAQANKRMFAEMAALRRKNVSYAEQMAVVNESVGDKDKLIREMTKKNGKLVALKETLELTLESERQAIRNRIREYDEVITAISEQHNAAGEEITATTKELDELRKKMVDRDREVEESRERLIEANKEVVARCQAERDDLERQCDEALAKLNKQTAIANKLRVQMDGLAEEMHRTHEHVVAMEEAAEIDHDHEAEIVALKETIRAKKADILAGDRALQAEIKRRIEATTQLESATKARDEAIKEREYAAETVRQLSEQLAARPTPSTEAYRHANEVLEQEKHQAEYALATANAKIAERDAQLAQMTVAQQALNTRIAELTAEIADLTARLHAHQETLSPSDDAPRKRATMDAADAAAATPPTPMIEPVSSAAPKKPRSLVATRRPK